MTATAGMDPRHRLSIRPIGGVWTEIGGVIDLEMRTGPRETPTVDGRAAYHPVNPWTIVEAVARLDLLDVGQRHAVEAATAGPAVHVRYEVDGAGWTGLADVSAVVPTDGWEAELQLTFTLRTAPDLSIAAWGSEPAKIEGVTFRSQGFTLEPDPGPGWSGRLPKCRSCGEPTRLRWRGSEPMHLRCFDGYNGGITRSWRAPGTRFGPTAIDLLYDRHGRPHTVAVDHRGINRTDRKRLAEIANRSGADLRMRITGEPETG